MNILKRFQRKIQKIAHDVRLLPAQMRLDHIQPDERARFELFSNKFADHFASVSEASDDTLMTQLWRDFNHRLSQTLLPHPRWDFLRDPVIASTMVLTKEGDAMNSELSYLESQYPAASLKSMLAEDPIGRPYIANSTYLTSHNTIHHVHHIAQFLEKTGAKIESIKTVVEWGGGYGNLAKLWQRFSKQPHSWIIIDTPLLCTLQWLYLASVLGPEHVHLVSTAQDAISPSGISIVPTGIAMKMDLRADLFVSTWAISESSPAAQQAVIDRKWFGAQHLLLGFQDSSAVLPHASDIATVAKNEGAVISDLPHISGQHYAFR